MNILPFVYAFLILMALGSSLLFDRAIKLRSEEVSFIGFFNSITNMDSEKSEREYKRAIRLAAVKKEEGVPAPIKEKNRDKLTYQSKRDKRNVIDLELSKFNLAALLGQEQTLEKEELYPVLCNLIRELYGHASFAKEPHFEREIVDALLLCANENKKAETLNDIFPEEHPAKELLFKVFSGTRNYDIEKKRGYPPLSHFVRLDDEQYSKPIYFYHASRPVLRAYFGEERAKKIAAAEANKWKSGKKDTILTRGELEKVVQIKPGELSNIVFSKKGALVKQTTGWDAKTGIYVTSPKKQ